MSDQEEDYDVTNRVLNDYLVEINVDFKLDNEFTNLTNEPKEDQQINTNVTNSIKLNPVLSQLFFDTNQLNHYCSSILNESDRKFLLEFILQIKSNLTSLNLNQVKRFIGVNSILITLVLLTSFLLNFVYLPLIYFIFIFVLFKLKLKLFDFLLKYSIKLTNDYVSQSQKIIYYLKEVHLVTLASKIRIQLETKSLLENNEIDLINYPFRRLCFKHFKQHFYELNLLNKKQLGLLYNQIDTDQFIANLKLNELSDVLLVTKEDELNRLTDYFSLNCLKSMLKLNRLVLGETIKLNQVNKMGLFVLDCVSLTQLVIKSFKFGVYLIQFQLKLIQFNSQLNDLHSICMLIKQSDQINEINTKLNSQENELEHILLNYVRQTLLDCYQLRKSSCLESKKELIRILKNDFEHCNLYFQKIISKLEPLNQMKPNEDFNLKDDKKILKKEFELVKIESEKPLIEEDIIYEADIIDSSHNGKAYDSNNDSNDMLLLKETKLLNKNLFYELKYALKSKQNEWQQRERKAKRIGDVNLNEETCKEDLFGLKDLTNHLLENDALKHKSIIKKRTRLEREKSEKTQNELNDRDDDIRDLNSFMTNAAFLSEFMSKRNKLIDLVNNQENIESNNDEIIYE